MARTWSAQRSTVFPSMVTAAARFCSVPSIWMMVLTAPAQRSMLLTPRSGIVQHVETARLSQAVCRLRDAKEHQHTLD